MYYILVILNVFAAAVAQMLLKKGADKEYSPFWRQYLNPWVVGGYFIMGLSMIANIFCLSKGIQIKEISIIESLSYLFVPLLSLWLFKETITKRKVAAIAVIMIGIVVFFW